MRNIAPKFKIDGNRSYHEREEKLSTLLTELFGEGEALAIHKLLNNIAWIELEEEGVLFKQGDFGKEIYLLIEGQLQAVLENKNRQLLGFVNEGEFVGEMAQFTGFERTATIEATRPSTLVKIEQAQLEWAMHQNPELIPLILKIFQKRLRHNQFTAIIRDIMGDLERNELELIEQQIEWVSLKGGSPLFKQGAESDGFYVLISGRLQAVLEKGDGTQRILGEIIKGETVGEMSVFNHEKRGASVYSIRDSVLVKISIDSFEYISKNYPKLLMHITKLIIQRMNANKASSKINKDITNICILPLSNSIDTNEFVDNLMLTLSPHGKILYLTKKRLEHILNISSIANIKESAPQNLWLSAWLDEQEANFDFVIYQTDGTDTEWTRRCLRQSDKILVLAEANSSPSHRYIEERFFYPKEADKKPITNARQRLILLHDKSVEKADLPQNTIHWLNHRNIETHHHIRQHNHKDFERLARYISGKTIGLVLGGGGAKGLAHIGMIRAFKEAGISFDMVGGTSMGGILGSLAAMDYDYENILHAAVNSLVKDGGIKQYSMLPFVSILNGQQVDKVLQAVSRDRNIEDLWIPFFCLSTDITNASMRIHEKGTLWRAIRATSSLPGIFPPVIQNGHLLVDGALMDNLPVEVMHNKGIDIIIAIDVSSEEDMLFKNDNLPTNRQILTNKLFSRKKVEYPGLMDVITRCMTIGNVEKSLSVQQTLCDYYFKPEVSEFGMLEFDAIQKIVDKGYEYGKQVVKEMDV